MAYSLLDAELESGHKKSLRMAGKSYRRECLCYVHTAAWLWLVAA